MGSVIVRNLDDATIGALKERAALAGTSLEQFLRDRLAELARPSWDELLEEIRAIRERSPVTDQSVVDDIRAFRDNLDDEGNERPWP